MLTYKQNVRPYRSEVYLCICMPSRTLMNVHCVQVLCTTSTLAMGVNLPAHLVVLKGTRRWTNDSGETAGYQEYDRSTCLQMIGRAGRPQFDTEGVAVIMTQKQVLNAHRCKVTL